ncbi:hypothetical protein GCM10022267_31820 [Lentzea roselyniae]
MAGETDPERLTRAFAALREAGITARENFTCCRSCGESEIGGEGGSDPAASSTSTPSARIPPRPVTG